MRVESAGEPLVVDVKAAAELLGVSPSAVHNLRNRDRFPLPFIQPLGPRGRVVFPRAQLEEWLAAETADPTRGWSRPGEVVDLRERGR